MKFFNIAFAFMLLFSDDCSAQLSVAKVDGPETANVGEIIELKAKSEVGKVAWALVQPSSRPVPYKTYEDGTVLVFSAPRAGEYEAIVFIAVLTSDQKIILTEQRHSVKVGGVLPEPTPVPPEPQPTPPDPDVPVPNNDYGQLTLLAKTSAPPTDKDKIKSNFIAGATLVREKVVTKFDDLVSITNQKNSESVGSSRAEDHPWHEFFVKIGTELGRLKEAGKLSTPDHWNSAWLAISKGL